MTSSIAVSARLSARWLGTLGVIFALAGCGGGGEEGHTSASGGGGAGSRRTAAPPSTAYVPSSSGGGGVAISEGFGSSHSAHPRMGGTAAALRGEEMRRIAAIERAHRPPGPDRLTGLDDDAQRLADWTEASHVRPISSSDDDSCERSWDQHVATTEAFHTRRHDGLHAPISAADRASFLATCRAQTPEMQQCGDPDYLTAHMDECEVVREREVREMHRRTHPTVAEPETDRDPLDSFDE